MDIIPGRMNKKFRIGDRVEVLDDTVKGVVSRVGEPLITVRTEEGFDFEYPPSKLLLRSPETLKSHEIPPVAISDGEARPPEKKRSRKRSKPIPPEIDLHIHQLRDSTQGMSNFEMVQLQLATAKKALDLAIERKTPRIIFIHGVGTGVLKQELRALLRTYDHLSIYDADFSKYGRGATEVRIYSRK